MRALDRTAGPRHDRGAPELCPSTSVAESKIAAAVAAHDWANPKARLPRNAVRLKRPRRRGRGQFVADRCTCTWVIRPANSDPSPRVAVLQAACAGSGRKSFRADRRGAVSPLKRAFAFVSAPSPPELATPSGRRAAPAPRATPVPPRLLNSWCFGVSLFTSGSPSTAPPPRQQAER
jgi:hypothetical protein